MKGLGTVWWRGRTLVLTVGAAIPSLVAVLGGRRIYGLEEEIPRWLILTLCYTRGSLPPCFAECRCGWIMWLHQRVDINHLYEYALVL